MISEEQRIFDWYFDNGEVSYRIYSQWTRYNPYSFYMFYGNAEYKVDISSVGEISENDGFTLNRAYVWDSTWTKQDECEFDISVGVDYNSTVNGREKKHQSYAFVVVEVVW